MAHSGSIRYNAPSTLSKAGPSSKDPQFVDAIHLVHAVYARTANTSPQTYTDFLALLNKHQRRGFAPNEPPVQDQILDLLADHPDLADAAVYCLLRSSSK